MKYLLILILVLLCSCGKDLNDGKVDPLPSIKFSKYVMSESNGDGLISRGETVLFKVFLKNESKVLARKVSVKFQLTTSDITGIPNNSIAFGNIAKEIELSDSSSKPTLELFIPKNTPLGVVRCNMIINDCYGEIWNDYFEFEIVGLNITLQKTAIIHDTNQDSVANPGEVVNFAIILINNGFKTDSLTAIFEADAPIIILNGMNQNLQSINSNSEHALNLSFNIPSNFNVPNIAKFKLKLQNKYGDEVLLNFNVNIDSSYTRFVPIVKLVADGNNNNEINKGEFVWIHLTLKNIGNIKANNVIGKIYSNLPDNMCIEQFEPNESEIITYGNILPNDSKPGIYSNFNGINYSFKFKINSNCVSGTRFIFRTVVNDDIKEHNLLFDNLIVQ